MPGSGGKKIHKRRRGNKSIIGKKKNKKIKKSSIIRILLGDKQAY